MYLSGTEAIRLAQQGAAAAFEYLYRLHSRHVYGICLQMMRNKTEAEDLTRKAFLESFRNIQSFRDESAFSTALLRLAVDLALRRRVEGNDPFTSDVLVFDLVR